MAPAKKVNHQSSVETTKQGKVPQLFEPISTFFEKKVRNIEKRKAKLETYRQLKKEGKLTDAGQKQAVEKYDEVQATLTFASTIMQELLPVLLEISNGVEKALLTAKRSETDYRKTLSDPYLTFKIFTNNLVMKKFVLVLRVGLKTRLCLRKINLPQSIRCIRPRSLRAVEKVKTLRARPNIRNPWTKV